MKIEVNKSGNSFYIVIPTEMAERLNLGDGDTLFATQTPWGYEISAYDPDFARKMDIARRGMKKYRNALRKLAK